MQNDQVPLFKDAILTCQICNKQFIFEKGEQKYYYIKDLALPKRCPKCRLAKKLHLQVGGNND
jgi:hypothetical protein